MSRNLEFREAGREMWQRGRALNDQSKYGEAEIQLQQAADRQEKTLGEDHKDTLRSKHWLGHSLYKQNKYSEAEVQFQQAADRREKTLGGDHKDTLRSKHWLGHSLCEQNKYSEAEAQFQQAADRQERTLGKDDSNTLENKYWLGVALYKQNKYGKAEIQLQQAADGQEKTLSKDDSNTLHSKYGLGLALYYQNKYSEAEIQLQQAADGQEKTLGKDDSNTLATFNQLQKLKLQFAARQLDSFFSMARDKRNPYTDSEINDISSLLNNSNHSHPQLSQVPRTYIVLRTIGHSDLLNHFIDLGFSDFWFPVTEQNLPGCLSPSARTEFMNAQQIVLTKSIDLEKGENGKHCHFKQEDVLPFESKGILGNGGFGQVDKVLSKISFKEYARKLVPRSTAFRGRRTEEMKQFIAEIQLLKRLKHRHIVEFVGSYTDTEYIGLIMLPVAEMDLGVYLNRCAAPDHPELRTFFGCLATALEFLHDQKVRHKDIKPGNILVDRGRILFADFGLSLDFTDASGSTTTGMTWKTLRYCSPEVAEYEPRNTSSDIWSLGVVFIEMAVVLKGKTIQDIDMFFRQHGSQRTYIWTNTAALPEFIAMLEGIGQPSDNAVFNWTKQMLCREHTLRLSASSLVTSIIESNSAGFCGMCCASPEEDFSDWTDE
jgi:tetratricopeptide (TPR) repeat protein